MRRAKKIKIAKFHNDILNKLKKRPDLKAKKNRARKNVKNRESNFGAKNDVILNISYYLLKMVFCQFKTRRNERKEKKKLPNLTLPKKKKRKYQI